MNISPLLSPEQAHAVARLSTEINVLREARECVTDTSTPAVIYGRVDNLINERQDKVLQIMRQANGTGN